MKPTFAEPASPTPFYWINRLLSEGPRGAGGKKKPLGFFFPPGPPPPPFFPFLREGVFFFFSEAMALDCPPGSAEPWRCPIDGPTNR